jgi:hypothetical protein
MKIAMAYRLIVRRDYRGHELATHSHPTDEFLTIISGKARMACGEKLDSAHAQPFARLGLHDSSGGYLSLLKKHSTRTSFRLRRRG